MIRPENSGDAAAIDRIVSGFGGDDTYTARLRSSGGIISELSLVSEDGSGGINGFIGCAPARTGGLDTPLITGVHAESDEIKKALVTELIRRAKEQGRDFLLACYDESVPYEELSFFSSVCFGIIPPGSFENIGALLCICLSGKKLAEAVRAELPAELEKSFTEPVFDIHTRLSTEEVEFAALDTRRRSRITSYFMDAALILFSVVMFAWKKEFFYLSPAVIAVVFRIRAVMELKKFREKMEQEKEGSKTGPINSQLLFYEDGLVAFYPDSSSAQFFLYKYFHYIFLKKDYMFVGYPAKERQVGGIYIMYRDIPDKEALISFIKKKTGGIRIMK